MDNNDLSFSALKERLRNANDTNKHIYSKQLLNIFKTTENPIVRNECALLLSEYLGNESVEPIVQALQNINMHKSRGTLLYALEGLDYHHYFPFIFELMFDDCFEVNRQARILIENAVENCSKESVAKEYMDIINNKCTELGEDIDYLGSLMETITG